MPGLAPSMSASLPNQSSPMMSGFVTVPQSHDQVVPMSQMTVAPQQIQMMPQPASVGQMPV